MANLATPNYYYFASRKSPPQHIVLKYHARGFGLGAFPPGIQRAIWAVASRDPVWAGGPDADEKARPALHAKGCFSAFSLSEDLA